MSVNDCVNTCRWCGNNSSPKERLCVYLYVYQIWTFYASRLGAFMSCIFILSNVMTLFCVTVSTMSCCLCILFVLSQRFYTLLSWFPSLVHNNLLLWGHVMTGDERLRRNNSNRWIMNTDQSLVRKVATERALLVSGISLINALSHSAWWPGLP